MKRGERIEEMPEGYFSVVVGFGVGGRFCLERRPSVEGAICKAGKYQAAGRQYKRYREGTERS